MSAHQRIWALLIPAIAAVLLYAHTFSADFVYDDRTLLELNPTMQSMDVVPKAFVTPFWELVDEDYYAVGFYRPLAATTFAATWVVSDGNPHIFHLLSILIHALCAVTLTLLCLSLGWRLPTACMAGTLFAILGAHSEAVAWISSQPDLLATLFTLIGLRYFVLKRHYRAPAFFFVALLCKESPLAIIILCLVMAIIQRRKFWPLLLCLASYYLLRVNAFDTWSAGFGRVNTHHGLTYIEQITLSFKLLGQHLGFMAVPVGHSPFHPLLLAQSPFALHNLLPILGAVLSLIGGLWAWRRKSSCTASVRIGLGLMFFGIAPVLNTFAMGQYPFAERFGYLASAGFVILVILFLTRLPYRSIAYAVAALLVAGNVYSSYEGSKNWRSEADLFRWAQQSSPNAMTGHVEFGRLMIETAQSEADPQRRANYAQLALAAYTKSDEIDVDKVFCTTIERYKANVGKADALFFLDEVDNAKKVYKRVVGHYGRAPEAFIGLGNCDTQAASQYLSQSQNIAAKNLYTSAIHAFNTALDQSPGIEAAIIGKAKALVMVVHVDGGISSPFFEEALITSQFALQVSPNDFILLLNLVALYDAANKRDVAIAPLRAYIARNPQHPEIKMLQQLLLEFTSQ
jgi:tetratricopeptide (TPR) repeat protein